MTVTEDVIKGNIAMIKHYDDGSTQIETPEVGAEFEVYLKSSGSYANAVETERDYLTCDENGFAQTKDMPYGIYTVHQTKGWEGTEFMADFDVKISAQLIMFSLINLKFRSTFSKVVGVGKAHKYFHLHNLTIAEQPAVWRLEHNGASL